MPVYPVIIFMMSVTNLKSPESRRLRGPVGTAAALAPVRIHGAGQQLEDGASGSFGTVLCAGVTW